MRPIKRPIRPNVNSEDSVPNSEIDSIPSTKQNPFSKTNQSSSSTSINQTNECNQSSNTINNLTQDNNFINKEESNQVNENLKRPKGNNYTYSFTSQKHSKLS